MAAPARTATQRARVTSGTQVMSWSRLIRLRSGTAIPHGRAPARHHRNVSVTRRGSVDGTPAAELVASVLGAELAAVFTGECRQYAARTGG